MWINWRITKVKEIRWNNNKGDNAGKRHWSEKLLVEFVKTGTVMSFIFFQLHQVFSMLMKSASEKTLVIAHNREVLDI